MNDIESMTEAERLAYAIDVAMRKNEKLAPSDRSPVLVLGGEPGDCPDFSGGGRKLTPKEMQALCKSSMPWHEYMAWRAGGLVYHPGIIPFLFGAACSAIFLLVVSYLTGTLV